MAVRNSEDFKGISVRGSEFKLSLFADDMLLFISKPVESLSNIMMIINKCSALAGFKVNYSKSTLLPISSDSNFFASHLIFNTFSLSTTPLKYLGILIPTSLSNLYQTNIKPVIQFIVKSLLGWRNLPLSLSGRLAVINLFLFPKLSYVLLMLPFFLLK